MSHEEEIELDDEMLAVAAGGGPSRQLSNTTITPYPGPSPMPAAPVVTNFSNHYMDSIG